ncbi:SDR family NAD(P)-dependent oxidoreductase [Paraburkholderia sp. CNPSo 3155]|uniref:SDR family NAD(P)-dependent oxidoreductase n=1 Tax=Paraburkholderia atlantica TaxID=2654982 RepID=UPI00128BE058|nr:SDR family NAD(P)-dependent oxidoreductase [Paraburkholderia atlantica]MPW06432.1 SDR family NAD(P)-dependent oxidoreductase [Paraburkholderia atlantica]
MNMTNKLALVTGSTDGLGRSVAKRLAAQGAHVLIHGRNMERGEYMVREIAGAGGKATFYPADLSTFAEVRSLASAIGRAHDQLDLLINNAGIGTGSPGSIRQVTADGIELRFAVNYLAGFALTRLLLPLLLKGSRSRIVNVASVGQRPIDFDDVMLSHGYSGTLAYCQSKLAQIMFTFDLADELARTSVTANCLHPATYMDTTMVRNGGITPLSTVAEGVDAVLHLAATTGMEGRTGLYFDGTRLARAHPDAYNPAIRKRLRQLSFQLTDPSLAH